MAGLCGLRRGEIAALRWRHVDFAAGHISVEQSAEQTRAGVRYKPPKSGRARTVAMGATVAAELRAHRLAQAETFLRLGIRLIDGTFVVAQADGSPLQPNTLTHNWVIEGPRPGCPGSGFMIYGTLMPRRCWLPASILRSPASGWGTARSG